MLEYFSSFCKMVYREMVRLSKAFFGLFRFFWFVVSTIAAGLQKPFYLSLFFSQLRVTAFDSIALLALTALFTGMVLALQSASAFSNFPIELTLPHIVALSITRELSPVIGGLMLAGRWGSSMAAELATMRVTDQIDALVTLSTHPLRYLIVPRILACTLALPFLIFLGDIIGIFGGGVIATHQCGMLYGQYISKILEVLSWSDVAGGMLKATVFGITIGFVGCYQGYYASGGTQGVGIATTRAVVHSSIIILLLNYVLTFVLF
jgi:phospholipid/cholesterol/gamma-HCH transport system permease protein